MWCYWCFASTMPLKHVWPAEKCREDHTRERDSKCTVREAKSDDRIAVENMRMLTKLTHTSSDVKIK